MRPASLRSKARACLLGGAIGDALGAPIEFMSGTDIVHRFGPRGITDFVEGDWPAGTITDDTQMTLFTAEGIIRAKLRWIHKGISHGPSVVSHAYLRWLLTQGEKPVFEMETETPGLLLSIPALHSRRAPGNTCLEALRRMTAFGEPLVALNTSKGCGGIMRMAPVGLFDAKENQVTWKDGGAQWSFDLGCELAALTHGHPTGFLAAGVFSAVIGALASGIALQEAIAAACTLLTRRESHVETLQAVERAVHAAKTGKPHRDAVEQLGGGWIAEEALSIGLYCALVATSYEDGVLLAVNHGGDSDSTGSIAGNLLGLIHGESALPQRWLKMLQLHDLIARVAEDLIDCPDFRSMPMESIDEREDLSWHAYPGY